LGEDERDEQYIKRKTHKVA